MSHPKQSSTEVKRTLRKVIDIPVLDRSEPLMKNRRDAENAEVAQRVECRETIR
jgi:hypothetical protein